ncbi:hypothetical protein EPUS_06812 [Endocarpon pusillum Z07020]|uniref:BHLH domain-containing protein n=1 Tax=Endocarpon pusillum (strain Z07020 / HMAS-L-300199) TaxID=1263415 RepID=U1HMA1_ENDPU|nr:uncharacterized protein EPUS_06812 [Endocarpon pusillum Z07020]ERF71430.1 hypothetical protein EPUS_06812 [Endocarpon pusillum Z07020]
MPQTVDSLRTRPAEGTSGGNFANRISNLASTSHHVWQLPNWNSQPGYSNPGIQAMAIDTFPPHDVWDPNDWNQSNFSNPSHRDSVVSKAESAYPSGSPVPEEFGQNLDFACRHPNARASSYGDLSSIGERLTPSPFSHAISPSTPGGSAWISVADSAYGSLPGSSHGSGSSEAESMIHATHYFASTNAENSPSCTIEAASRTVTNLGHLQTSPINDVPSTLKATPADQKDRLRQDAHSKVEKRYRMNINSKIQQLREILPNNHSCERPSLRRKSGTELSKRDILSLTITNMERLQFEVQNLTSQNRELKARIARMQSDTAHE